MFKYIQSRKLYINYISYQAWNFSVYRFRGFNPTLGGLKISVSQNTKNVVKLMPPYQN